MNAYEISLTIPGDETAKLSVLRTLSSRAIAVKSVTVWLREKSLWFRSSPTEMVGALEAIYRSPRTPQKLRDGLGLLWSSVFGDGAEELHANEVQWAPTIYEVVSGIAAASPALSGFVDQFYALGGGRPFKDIDSAGLAEAKSIYDTIQEVRRAESAKQDLKSIWHRVSQNVFAAIADGSIDGTPEIIARVNEELS